MTSNHAQRMLETLSSNVAVNSLEPQKEPSGIRRWLGLSQIQSYDNDENL